MQRIELIRRLKKSGWKIKTGDKHCIAEHRYKIGKIPIPKADDINDYTAKGILKVTGAL